MSRFLQVRVAVALIGVAVWGFGLLRDDERVRLVGIAVLALSLVLRFVPGRFRRDDDAAI